MSVDYFLKIDGIDGEATDSKHTNEIQVESFKWTETQSADFARGTPSPPLDPLVGRPLSPDPDIARQMRPYERMKAAEARDANLLQLPPPEVRSEARKEEKPLPLPGGPRGALEPNPITSPRPPD